MLDLGIDQRARQITISLRDEHGDVLQARQVSTQPEKINAFSQQFTHERPHADASFVAVLEAAGVKRPDGMNGKSLWPVLTSRQSGLVDPERTWVVTGRERHVGDAREGNRPYPQRALRTRDFLYVRNFAPDRYPLGDPKGVTAEKAPAANALENDTLVAFADMDASPTKAWLVAYRHDPRWQWHYDHAFGKRPVEELYDLRSDPNQMKNVAGDKAYEETRKKLAEQLTKILTASGDPRVVEKDCRFEKPPFTDSPQRKK